jgi:hypothetical protein
MGVHQAFSLVLLGEDVGAFEVVFCIFLEDGPIIGCDLFELKGLGEGGSSMRGARADQEYKTPL